ncbi:ABC transporter substrate-binding protein [Paenibacillus taichungensis]|uniref:ABC transporter substrate-binding protein n=1 Tax=Paenibacillus taichungensis TaxID=484184 RepID=UPI0035E20A15
MRKTGIILTLTFILLAVTACTPRNTAPPLSSSLQELQEVNVVLDWYPNALHAFLYVAMEKGYFEQEGLKVNLQFPSNSNDAISLVAAGKADVGLYYQQDVIITRANQQVPVKSIGAVVQAPLNAIISLAEKNITSPQDLKGKTIGYSGTELSEALIRSIMKHAGTDNSDVKMVDVGFELMSSMTTNNVDATIGGLINHEVPQLQEEGFDVNWFTLEKYGVPSYYEGIFVANDTLIASDSDMLTKFLRASKKGFEDVKADPEAALQILLDHQSADHFPLSEDVERQSLDILLPLMENDKAEFLSQDDSRWQENIDWLQSEGLIKTKPALDDVLVVIPYE